MAALGMPFRLSVARSKAASADISLSRYQVRCIRCLGQCSTSNQRELIPSEHRAVMQSQMVSRVEIQSPACHALGPSLASMPGLRRCYESVGHLRVHSCRAQHRIGHHILVDGHQQRLYLPVTGKRPQSCRRRWLVVAAGLPYVPTEHTSASKLRV